MVKLESVRARPEYRVYLEYSDSKAGEVDLSHLVGKGVFAVWNDPAIFKAVSVGAQGEIRWTDDLEICADALYLEITGQDAGDLFPNLKTPADA